MPPRQRASNAEETPAEDDRPTLEQQVAAIAVILMGGAAGTAAAGGAVKTPLAPVTLTAEILVALTRLLRRWGYAQRVMVHTLRTITTIITPPGPRAGGGGPAGKANRRAEATFAARFIAATAGRVEAAYRDGATPGVPEARERRYIDQHVKAQAARRAAAADVDDQAAKQGQTVTGDGRTILTWRAHPDDRTTIECRAADGAWFYADEPTIIGYPGMPHGGTCRCWPGKAGPLTEVAATAHVNDAVSGIIGSVGSRRHPGSKRRRTRSTA